MRRLFCLALVALSVAGAAAQPADRKLLARAYPLPVLEHALIPLERFQPYPTYRRPEGLEAIPAALREAYVRRAEAALHEPIEELPATLSLEYVRSGERNEFTDRSFARRRRLETLVMAELFERRGRFMDAIVNSIWAICEESFWGASAHLGAQRAPEGLADVEEPIVDLFAAETGATLAWVHYLLGPELDRVHPLVARRIRYETDRRILTPFLARDDFGWMGFRWRAQKDSVYVRPVNNWNPWINSNVLSAALFLEQDPARRLRIVYKVMDSSDNFILPYPADGGCDEGPSYWNRAAGAYFDVLERLAEATGGKITAWETPLVRNMGRYIAETYIADPYFINFSDASARLRVEPATVYRYGKAIGDADMMGLAAYTAELVGYGAEPITAGYGSFNRNVPALLGLAELRRAAAREPLLRDVHLPDVQVMAARSAAGARAGFFLAAQGGHNDESHNHNDVGNFVVYHNGLPVLVDAGAALYTAATFSSRRYDLWNNQSAYHNAPTINGVMQRDGRAFAARDVAYAADDREAAFTLEMAGAYPPEAAVQSWRRRVALRRGRDVTLTDAYRLAAVKAPQALHFLTPLPPEEAAPGRVRLVRAEDGRRFDLVYDARRFAPSVERIALTDSRMRGSWGEQLFRVTLTERAARASGRSEVRIEEAR